MNRMNTDYVVELKKNEEKPRTTQTASRTLNTQMLGRRKLPQMHRMDKDIEAPDCVKKAHVKKTYRKEF